MCSQRVHYSVSVAFAGFSSCGSLAVLDVPSLSPSPNNFLSTEPSGSSVMGA